MTKKKLDTHKISKTVKGTKTVEQVEDANKHIGSSLGSLFDELGEKPELDILTQKKLEKNTVGPMKQISKVQEKIVEIVAKNPTPTQVIAKKIPTITTGQLIWEKIKDRQVNLFGFPNKEPLSHYFKFVALDPNKCFLTHTTKATSAVVVLEDAAPEYDLEQSGKYIILTMKQPK